MPYSDPVKQKEYFKEYHKKYNLKNRTKMNNNLKHHRNSFNNGEENKREYKYNESPDVLKNRSLKRDFGITLEQYKKMQKEQSNLCLICLNPETTVYKDKVRNLAVDHCHVTNKIRGLLCQKCNQGLGLFKDNIDFLNSAIKYLQRGA